MPRQSGQAGRIGTGGIHAQRDETPVIQAGLDVLLPLGKRGHNRQLPYINPPMNRFAAGIDQCDNRQLDRRPETKLFLSGDVVELGEAVSENPHVIIPSEGSPIVVFAIRLFTGQGIDDDERAGCPARSEMLDPLCSRLDVHARDSRVRSLADPDEVIRKENDLKK